MGRVPSFWLLAAALAGAPAAAQNQGLVVRDGTLGEDPPGPVAPGIDPNGEFANYLITPQMGEQRGDNLFHSFMQFSIGEGETATFTGPADVDNVISRVTGPDPSEIDGTLRSTIPGADVWLLNPSGVVFGEGAQLDVPGSFHASTGDYVGFEGLERFYADRNPALPSVLSTAPPAAFGFLSESGAAPISVTGASLAVHAGKALDLVGGDVTLTAATLGAPGGAISIRGGHIVVQEGSKVLAENAGESPAGTITVAASESVLVDNSLLSVSADSAGDAGKISVKSPEVTFQNGPGLANFYDPNDPSNLPHRVSVGARAETTSSGKAGTLEIDADAFTVTAGAGLSAQTVGNERAFASGDGGDIRIHAGSVLVSDLGFATVESWRSTGDAGSITVGSSEVPADTLTIDATRADGLGSYPTTLTATSLTRRWVKLTDRLGFGPAYDPADLAPGEAGTIEIWARAVDLVKGGSLEAWCIDCITRGGTIQITADEMKVDGLARGESSSSLVSVEAVGPAARGGGGDIFIDLTGTLELRGGGLRRGGGFLSASTAGDRDAGIITIDANSVNISEKGGISASTSGSGDAGTITIGHAADPVRSLTISNGDGINAGSQGGPGNAGTISIDADSLVIAPGGFIDAGARDGSSGKGGSVTIRADSVHVGPHPDFPKAPGLGAMPGAFINASSRGPDGAGTIDIVADRSIVATYAGGPAFNLREFLLGRALGAPAFLSGIFSATFGSGAGGAIHLKAPEITVTDGAIVASSTVGGGVGGNVVLEGKRLRVANGGAVDSTSVPNSVAGGGDAGSVTLDASESIEIVGRRLALDLERHPVDQWSRVTSASLGSGAAGAVTLKAPRIVVDGGAVATTAAPDPAGFEGQHGGEITLDARFEGGQVLVTGGGRVDASTFIPGPGGEIAVTASDSIRVEGSDGSDVESGIASRTGGLGAGGGVTLTAPHIEIAEGGEVSARSEPGLGEVGKFLGGWVGEAPIAATGTAGSVKLLGADEVRLFGSTIATSAATADGGSITIQAQDLVHLDAGTITASVNVNGAPDVITTGGNIKIDPEVMILQNRSTIATQAGGERAFGGHIDITADNYFAFPDSTVSAAAGNPDLSGTVEVNTPDVNLAGQLTTLPTSYLDAASLMKERCAARRSGERAGSFAVRGSDGIPAEPDGWLPAMVGYGAGRGAVASASHAARPASFASLPFPGTCP